MNKSTRFDLRMSDTDKKVLSALAAKKKKKGAKVILDLLYQAARAEGLPITEQTTPLQAPANG